MGVECFHAENYCLALVYEPQITSLQTPQVFGYLLWGKHDRKTANLCFRLFVSACHLVCIVWILNKSLQWLGINIDT